MPIQVNCYSRTIPNWNTINKAHHYTYSRYQIVLLDIGMLLITFITLINVLFSGWLNLHQWLTVTFPRRARCLSGDKANASGHHRATWHRTRHVHACKIPQFAQVSQMWWTAQIEPCKRENKLFLYALLRVVLLSVCQYQAWLRATVMCEPRLRTYEKNYRVQSHLLSLYSSATNSSVDAVNAY